MLSCQVWKRSKISIRDNMPEINTALLWIDSRADNPLWENEHGEWEPSPPRVHGLVSTLGEPRQRWQQNCERPFFPMPDGVQKITSPPSPQLSFLVHIRICHTFPKAFKTARSNQNPTGTITRSNMETSRAESMATSGSLTSKDYRQFKNETTPKNISLSGLI
jgi:hypothetical protein